MPMARHSAYVSQTISVVFVAIVYLFLLAPVFVVMIASFDGGDPIAGRAFLKFPPSEWSTQWFFRIPDRLYDSLWVSVQVAVVASLGGIVIGVPAALATVRGRFRGKSLIEALFKAPLQIPFIVIGVAFLQTYYFIAGITGININGTFLSIVLGHMFVCTPYVFGSVGAVLHRFNLSLEEAALSLGASRWTTFRRVSLPIIMPGIYTGGLFGFMTSFGDIPISLFLASPKYMTLPLEIYHSMEFDFDPSVLPISTLVVVASGLILWIIQRVVGLDVLLRSGGTG